MAAAIVINDMEDYLIERLDVLNNTLRNRILDEGFEDMESLVQKDEDWVKDACTSVRKSGGADATRRITANLRQNMIALVYWARLMYLLQRPYDYLEATVPLIHKAYEWFTSRKADDEPAAVQTYSETVNKRDWFQSMENYLACTTGSAGVPILYLVTTDGVIDPAAPVPPITEDTDLDVMLSQRGIHEGKWFKQDNSTLWTFLHKICFGTKAYQTIEQFQRAKNGTSAYRALKNMYLGADVQKLMRVEADRILKTIRFDGRSSRFPYHVFTPQLTGAIRDLGPDDQPSEPRKVEIFLNAFQVPGLHHVRSTISRDPILRNSLEATMEFCAEQMAQLKTMHGSPFQRALAAVEHDETTDDEAGHDGNRKGTKTGKRKSRKYPNSSKHATAFDENDPSAYVPKEVWQNMTAEEKEAARASREELGIPTSGSRGSANGDQSEEESTQDETDSAQEEESDSEQEALAKKKRKLAWLEREIAKLRAEL